MLGAIRHIIGVAVLMATFVPSPLQAGGTDETLRLFATCTGRLSAKMEHQWLIGDPKAEITEIQRNNMADLLEAVQPDGAGPRVMSYRIGAKMAHRRLLERATFATDPDDARWALQRAESFLSPCTAMLLT